MITVSAALQSFLGHRDVCLVYQSLQTNINSYDSKLYVKTCFLLLSRVRVASQLTRTSTSFLSSCQWPCNRFLWSSLCCDSTFCWTIHCCISQSHPNIFHDRDVENWRRKRQRVYGLNSWLLPRSTSMRTVTSILCRGTVFKSLCYLLWWKKEHGPFSKRLEPFCVNYPFGNDCN